MNRHMVRFALAAVATAAVGAVSLAGLPVASPANAEEAGFTITVDKVTVNQFGGIQVEGTIDCTAAVENAYRDVDARPDMVLVNVNWEAYQFVGRTRVVHAEYDSGIASACYLKDTPGPYMWSTQRPFPDGQPYWVYSPDGKFASGRIHVEADGFGGWAVPEIPEVQMPDLYSWGQADLKAAKDRK